MEGYPGVKERVGGGWCAFDFGLGRLVEEWEGGERGKACVCSGAEECPMLLDGHRVLSPCCGVDSSRWIDGGEDWQYEQAGCNKFGEKDVFLEAKGEVKGG